METYLQTAWGDQWDNVTMDIVRTAIDGLKKMDEEHGAFWVGLIKNDENVLEVHKDLGLFGVFEDEPGMQYRGQGKDWVEIEVLFQNFLADKMNELKTRLNREE